ncbi:hypothetical protein FXO38_02807 [Capsicum annuum]|nr:hypothetical protein FXO37_05358 [Capsicum annuum]KAF3679365.1 hypothetical protein FXO38_02807 [Capsicum annuum]
MLASGLLNPPPLSLLGTSNMSKAHTVSVETYDVYERLLYMLHSSIFSYERYDEYRQISDFIKGYIFPDGCLPALSRVTSAMAAASRQCQIRALGFDDKFIRTWEYYFDYCTAGFKTCTIGDYQGGVEDDEDAGWVGVEDDEEAGWVGVENAGSGVGMGCCEEDDTRGWGAF